MIQRKKRSNKQGWAQCRATLMRWPAAGLRELIHEFYKLSDANRQFLDARLSPAGSDHSRAALEKAKATLRRMLAPDAFYAQRFRQIDAKRFVDQYEKATDDPALVAELLLADLARSLATFKEVGDDETMINHIYATLQRLDKLQPRLTDEAVVRLQQELEQLGEQYQSDFGYGISDEVIAMAAEWKLASSEK